jgi:predicted ATPase
VLSEYYLLTEIEHLDPGPRATIIIDSYGGLWLHEQSNGESFLTLMTHRFGSHGLYLLDEPEAALSHQRQLAVLWRMNDLVKASSQFIIATHSPILLAYPEATIYGFGPGGIREMAYEETEHYQVMSNVFRILGGCWRCCLRSCAGFSPYAILLPREHEASVPTESSVLPGCQSVGS